MNASKTVLPQTSECPTLGSNIVQEVSDLITLMGKSHLAELDIEMPHVRLTIRKQGVSKLITSASPILPPVSTPSFVSPEQSFPNDNENGPQGSLDLNEKKSMFHEILSPMAGTFYRSSSPSSPPFVREGDLVKLGQSVCIVEAMKLMNEIKADKSGTVVKILAENALPVEKGTVLFYIEGDK